MPPRPVHPADTADGEISFGSFRLRPSEQLLLENERPIQIGARALDVLTALVERAGVLVTKGELIARAWPNVSVDEGNLRTQMAIIRKALRDGEAGSRYIVTVPGRGYRFVAPVSHRPMESELGNFHATSHIPSRLTRVIGRADTINEVTSRLARNRFTTIVGPGGVGKTTVALAVAEQQIDVYTDGICVVDIAPLIDPATLPTTLASMLGLNNTSRDAMATLTTFLRNKHFLLVLDSCERFVEATAALAEGILKGTLALHVLATSREPLRADGEAIYRLPPLTAPSTSDQLSAQQALAFPAVELFVERAASSIGSFELVDEEAPIVADICRQLDGIALAIELAAGRVSALGVKGVANYLRDRFRLLRRGKRTALPRHQTLEATLDWSYETLPLRERTALRRLSIFPAKFALEAAIAVVANGDIPAAEVFEIIDELIAKSLVSADIRDAERAYRLLDTTRAYAANKLSETGESEHIAQLHAEFCLHALESSQGDKDKIPTRHFLSTATPLIEDIRSALNWAFSPDGNDRIGADLAIACIPLWTQLSLNAECRRFAELALAYTQGSAEIDASRKMKLFAALGASLIYTDGPGPKANEAWEHSLKYAQSLDNTDYQSRALWGLFQVRFNTGKFRDSLRIAEQLRQLGANSSDPADSLLGDRLVGLAQFYLGDHVNGRRHIESMLDGHSRSISDTHVVRFQFDQKIVAQTILARILWALGQPDAAMSTVHDLLDEADSMKHAMSLSLGLAQAACPIALWRGDYRAAQSFIARLIDNSAKHGLDLWSNWGHCFEGMLLIASGDHRPGLQTLRASMNKLPLHNMRYGGTYAYLAEALGAVGEVSHGLAVIQEAIGRSEEDEERWHIAEFLRIKGELFQLQHGPSATDAAEDCFQQSLTWARRQHVLSWELRTAMSLARLRVRQNRPAEARELLKSRLVQFQEGFETADLVAAETLIEQLR